MRRDRRGRRGAGVTVYVREGSSCLELDDGADELEYFWVRIRGKAKKADSVEGVCYRAARQHEEAGKILPK